MTDKQTDKRLQRTYGITLEEYNALLAKFGGGCWICGSTPKERRLHTDHDHKIPKLKIICSKADQTKTIIRWYAVTAINPLVSAWDTTKVGAIRKVRRLLKRASVRGIICWPCNRALRVFNDNPDRLEAAAKYLRNYKEKGNQLG